MHIAILTFEGFNELDSLIALGILNRLRKPAWRVSIGSPTARVRSMNGMVLEAQATLRGASAADAIDKARHRDGSVGASELAQMGRCERLVDLESIHGASRSRTQEHPRQRVGLPGLWPADDLSIGWSEPGLGDAEPLDCPK